MNVEDHTWATKELAASAEEFANELVKELTWQRRLTLLFVPLVHFESSGFYRLTLDTPWLVVYANGTLQWNYPVREEAFLAYEDESRNAARTLRDYLRRLLAYTLAHGIDVAKVDEEGNGRSILHALPHHELYGDVGGYDS